MFLTKTFLPLFIFALSCHLHTGEAQCKTKLPRRRGTFSYPNHKACGKVPAWELRMNRKQSVRYTFINLDLGNGSLVIKQKKWARQPYVTRHVFNRNTTIMEAVIESPYKFSIVRAIDVVSFTAVYDVYFCPIPGPEVTNMGCTGGFNSKFSTCSFQCHRPNYFPRRPEYMMPSNSTCKGNRKWKPDPTLKCMPLSELERLCYQQNDTCPFTPDQLLTFFSESDSQLTANAPRRLIFLPPPPPVVIQTPPPSLQTFPDGVEGRFAPVPPVAAAQVTVVIDWSQYCQYEPVCQRISSKSKIYLTATCGSFSAANDGFVQKLCMICRFLTMTCDTFLKAL